MNFSVTDLNANLTGEMFAFLENNVAEFEDIQLKCKECLVEISEELGSTVPHADDFFLLLQRKIGIEITYSFYLGLVANLEYFSNPIANDFLKFDFDSFLLENRLHTLPDYREVQEKMDKFYDSLSSEYKDKVQTITEYESFIETYVPKTAHYWGFRFGNDFFLAVKPGYAVDSTYTRRYKNMIEEYLNVKLSE